MIREKLLNTSVSIQKNNDELIDLPDHPGKTGISSKTSTSKIIVQLSVIR